jgi:hypothetical protein
MSATAETIFRGVLDQHPKLCESGYNYNYRRNHGPDGQTPQLRFNQAREYLTNSLDSVQQAIAWIGPIKRTKTAGDTCASSYGLKHVMERQSGVYVTNGAFIAAALMLGVPVGLRPCQRGITPNPAVGLARRSYTNHPVHGAYPNCGSGHPLVEGYDNVDELCLAALAAANR